MKIIIESGLTLSIPKTKNATDYVKQSVTIEIDDTDIASMMEGGWKLADLEKAIENTQNLAADRVFDAVTKDLEELGVT